MRRIPPLLVALTRDWLRNREAVFFAFMFPIVLLLIFSAVFGGGAAEFTLYVQNEDVDAGGEPTDLSATFVDALNETEPLNVRPLDADRNVTEWAREGHTTGSTRVLIVPDGFADQVRAGSVRARQAVILDTVNRMTEENGTDVGPNESDRERIERGTQAMANQTTASGPATVEFRAATDDEAAPAIRGILESVVARFNEEAIGVKQPPANLVSADLGRQDIEGVNYYLPALIAAVVMINGLITLTSVVAEFNADGTLKRLVATPLRRREWILANVVQQSILAVVTTYLMVVVAHVAFDVTVVPGPLSIALIILGAIGFAGLGMALGSWVDSPEAATSLGMGIALPLMFVSGVFWELDLMPASLQTLATLLPVYHFHRGLRQLMVVGTTEGVALPFAVLGVVAIVSVVLAVRVTTWQDF